MTPGEWVGIIGPNGAGKSSLLRAIAGLVAARGTMSVDGIDLAGLGDRERAQRIAYVPQEPLIPADMTVFEYVLLGRTPYIGYLGSRRATTGPSSTRCSTACSSPSSPIGCSEPSAVANANGSCSLERLAQETPVLLLDEPTSALDIGHQQQALELVTELRQTQQLTVISSLHDLTLAGTYTDRLVMLDHGEVVAAGPAREVLTAERLGEVYRVCVTVDVDPEDGAVIVVPRRGFPSP